ncbi:hypothetical protein D3C84_1237410 [compost metagenome]
MNESPKRLAVSISEIFINAPPSPVIQMTWASGQANFAPMEPGKAIPIEARPFDIMSPFDCFG